VSQEKKQSRQFDFMKLGSSVESKEDAQPCIPFIKLSLLLRGHRHDKQGRMPLTEDEMKALRLLLREELQAEVRPFRSEVEKRFDEFATQMDGLHQRDEKREFGNRSDASKASSPS
jgi:hypothetical protein